jgi:hypothetical protein
MAEYQRINVKQKWYDKVSDYLKEHPEEGFEPDEVKEFVKAVVNQHLYDDLSTFDKETFAKNLKEELDL